MAARLLDLTRLVSRFGSGPMTGVDRVEYAYLAHLLGLESAVFGLVRTRIGFALLDRSGVEALADLVRGNTSVGKAACWGVCVIPRYGRTVLGKIQGAAAGHGAVFAYRFGAHGAAIFAAGGGS